MITGYSLTYHRFMEIFDAINTNVQIGCKKTIMVKYGFLPVTKGNCSLEMIRANRLIGEYKRDG